MVLKHHHQAWCPACFGSVARQLSSASPPCPLLLPKAQGGGLEQGPVPFCRPQWAPAWFQLPTFPGDGAFERNGGSFSKPPPVKLHSVTPICQSLVFYPCLLPLAPSLKTSSLTIEQMGNGPFNSPATPAGRKPELCDSGIMPRRSKMETPG